METWFIVLVSLCLSVLLKTIFQLKNKKNKDLPPGPLYIPIITSILWLRKSFTDLEPILRNLHAKYGPIVTLRIGSRPSIFIADRYLAHRALVQNGVVFSDRPKSPATSQVISSNQRSINTSFYGPTWRVLRRNLASEMLHSSRVKSFSGVRKRVLDIFLDGLKSDSESGNSIRVMDHIQYAMFCLLVFMCFGDRVGEKEIRDIEDVQRRLLLNFDRFDLLNFWPRITKILFHNRWEELLKLRKDQEAVMVPLIRERKKVKEAKHENVNFVSYVDTLLDLEWSEEKRKLDEGEIVTLCSEFFNAGTDTTSTALQWIMANIVKYPNIQQRVVEEIEEVMRDRDENEVKEEDLNKMPYVKAVVLEGLRRHSPGHFVLPHAVTEDVVLNDYLVPKNGTVNFMVADMALDPNVWEDPMAFKPERFLNSGKTGVELFDITGSKEIKMMPFGAGRRMCPGYHLAMLHLEYFLANLVWNFEWKAPNGGDVDLSEKQEFTMTMKYPLQAHITPRF